MVDVTILTESRYVLPLGTERTPYIENVLLEDQLVQEALERRGFSVQRVDWADSEVDWTLTRCALFRTTWDYFNRWEEFADWLERTARCTQLVNSADMLRWNLDKKYLLELASCGVNVAPTKYIQAGTGNASGGSFGLVELFEETGWHEAVLKPAISGGARHTYRIARDEANKKEALFQRLVESESMLLQQFLNRIMDEGELSLMVIGGRCTHAVRKNGKAGDFRVQDDHGGVVSWYDPNAAEIAFAENVLAACPFDPIYARVDMVKDNFGEWSLAELELVEPELWFRFHPEAAESLADALAASIFLQNT